MSLTTSQRRILDTVRRDGPHTYTGVATRPIERLEELGLVTVDWDSSLDKTKGRLRWYITVTAKEGHEMTKGEAGLGREDRTGHRGAGAIPPLAEAELGTRAASYLDIENSPWAYKFWWMTGAWWWDADTGTWVRETRPEILKFSLDTSGCPN